MKEIEELQILMNDISKWSDETFDNGNNYPDRTISIMYHLKEEVEETIEALKSYFDTCSNDKFNLVIDEIVDCFILLLDCAKHMNISASCLIDRSKIKLQINKKRIWGTPDKNGVIHHIKSKKYD